MPHETTFIATIVVGLVLAFLGGLLASKLSWTLANFPSSDQPWIQKFGSLAT